MTVSQRSTLAAALLAPIAYFLCLRFLFPGYFAPLVPHHTDLYLPVGLLRIPWGEIFSYPRPVAFVFLKLVGALGLQGSIAAPIALVIAGAILTVVVVERWIEAPVSIVSVACFMTVLFAHPEFYFQHRHDVPAALSYLFLLPAADYWSRWLDSRRPFDLAVSAGFAALLGLTKETYGLSLGILVLGLALVKYTGPVRRLLAPVFAIGLALLAATTVNLFGYWRWLSPPTPADRSYQLALSPRVVWLGELFYLKHLMNWAAVLLVVAAVLFAVRKRRNLVLCLMLIAAGVCSLVPNSLLPNHVYEEYAWAAAPLVFAPVLTVSGRLFPAIAVVLTGLWVGSNRAEYHAPARQWLIGQEQQNARIVASFPALRRIDPKAHRVIVAGLRASFVPWGASRFVEQAFGNHQWVWVVPRDAPLKRDAIVELSLGRNIPLAQADYAVLYDSSGNLIGQFTAAELRNSRPDLILIPELRALQAGLKQTPDDFGLLMKAGVLYVDWGWPDLAQPYLQRASRAVNGTNPYPFYFLGLCSEDLHRTEEARGYYQRAIELEKPPANANFREALNRVSATSK